MFTGIVEAMGRLIRVESAGTNYHYQFKSAFDAELKVDQSLAHDGVCLTVTEISEEGYWVTAIEETLRKTALSNWKPGYLVNLERCLPVGGRLDGHMVQGHVDTVGEIVKLEDRDGSWEIGIRHEAAPYYLTVPKGSIAVNGTSLTVVESRPDYFSIALIPYTWEHTNFHQKEVGSKVNLEFDILGKYIARLHQQQQL